MHLHGTKHSGHKKLTGRDKQLRPIHQIYNLLVLDLNHYEKVVTNPKLLLE